MQQIRQLLNSGYKHGMDGIAYAVKPDEVADMMRRYDVARVQEVR